MGHKRYLNGQTKVKQESESDTCMVFFRAQELTWCSHWNKFLYLYLHLVVIHEAALSQNRDFKPITIRWDPLSAQFHQFKSQPIIKLQKWTAPCSNRPFKAEWVSLEGVSAVFSAAESTEHHHGVCCSRACSSSSIFLWETALLEMEFLSCICQISSYQTLRPLTFPLLRVLRGLCKGSRGSPDPREVGHEPASVVRCC